jgi:SecD-like export protein
MRPRNHLSPLILGVAALAIQGCGSPSERPSANATTPPPEVRAAPFNVGVAVPGAPNPNDPAFVADQQHLYDSSQFSDPTLYPRGYHWKIDAGIGPRGVRSAHAVHDSVNNQWVISIEFTPAAAQHFRADTEAAYRATQSNPSSPPAEGHIAFFIGNQVVSAPFVQSPSGNDTEIAGNFTAQQADDLARAIVASSQLS